MFETKKFFLLLDVVLVIGTFTLLFITHSTLREYQHYEVFLTLRFLAVPYFGYVCGYWLAGASLFAFCSTIWCRSYRLLRLLLGVLCIAFVLLLGLAIAALIIRDQAFTKLNPNMLATMKSFVDGNAEAQLNWDYIQYEFTCCGVDWHRDWLEVIDDKLARLGYLPISCCHTHGAIGEQFCRVDAYLSSMGPMQNDGCGTTLGVQLYYLISDFCIFGFVYAAVLLTPIIKVCCICKKIAERNSSYEEVQGQNLIDAHI